MTATAACAAVGVSRRTHWAWRYGKHGKPKAPPQTDFQAWFMKAYGLSQRYAEIVEFVLAGESNQDIGRRYAGSPNTVKWRLRIVYKAINNPKVKNRYGLILYLTRAAKACLTTTNARP